MKADLDPKSQKQPKTYKVLSENESTEDLGPDIDPITLSA